MRLLPLSLCEGGRLVEEVGVRSEEALGVKCGLEDTWEWQALIVFVGRA